MKNEFKYGNPIFISEVKKRLAEKRNYRLKTRLKSIDKFPLENEFLRKGSSIHSNKSQTNLKYFLNFIKEKGYKSINVKINDTIDKIYNEIVFKNKLINKNMQKIKMNQGLSDMIKLFNSENNNEFYRKINKKKIMFNNQRQTPFQINHIKNDILKLYVAFSKKRNAYSYLKDEKTLKSYSINNTGKKIKIFGNKNYIKRSLSVNRTNNRKINKIKYNISYLNRDYNIQKLYNTIKPNCYYNRLNLKKNSLILKQKKREIEKNSEN